MVRVAIKLGLSDNLQPVPVLAAHVGSTPCDLRFSLTALRRGKAVVERFWLRNAGPQGLMQNTLEFPVDKVARAEPDMGLLKRQTFQHFSAREYRAGLKMERYPGEGSELESVREFMTGMDHRHIHWKASARHAKLLCRQFRAERSHQVILAIDTGRLMGEAIDRLPRLDHAIHSALLMTYMTARSGDRLGFYSFAARPGPFYPARAGMKAARSIIQLAGDLEYSTGETNYAWSLAALQGHLKRRSLVVVFTDFVDTATAELLVESLQHIVRRHLVVFVALRDPLLSEAQAAAPTDFHLLNRALVADNLLQEREVVLKKLTRMGVRAIDAAPRDVSIRLLNKYLEVKRREMI